MSHPGTREGQFSPERQTVIMCPDLPIVHIFTYITFFSQSNPECKNASFPFFVAISFFFFSSKCSVCLCITENYINKVVFLAQVP